jgi:facilitated trehalose transporter
MLVRVAQGMCAGCFSSVVPLIIKELAPFELSGFFGVFHQLFITIGISLCCLFTLLLSLATDDYTGQSYWKLIFGLPLLTIALQVVCLRTVFDFETPKYLVEVGQEEQARELIAKFYHQEYVDDLLAELRTEGSTRKETS